MTDLEQIRARALAQCTMLPGSFDKRFARDLNSASRHAPALPLSEAQRNCLIKMAWRYRDQLKREGFGHVIPSQNPYGEHPETQQEED